MASAATHREWAKRNEELFEYIGGPASYWSDWAVTLLFYAAVHEITAFLVENHATLQASGFSVPDNHRDRKKVLRALWPTLSTSYEPLEGRSFRARYWCKKFSENEVKMAQALLVGLRKEIASLSGQQP